MPTYEYKCNACAHRFEQFQSMKDKPLKKCPACGKNALERLIGTGAAVLFKGSGFYQTDYRSEGYKKAAAAEKPAGDAKPDAGKSDGAKPAATTNGASKPAESKPAPPAPAKKKS
jgi:putative FmdB family regulatory protein